MIRLLLSATLAVAAAAAIGPVQAQTSSLAAVPPQSPAPAYSGSSYQPYPFPALTPEDAYRDGVINRWELERYVGPLPQALQGPAVNSNRGSQDGGGKE